MPLSGFFLVISSAAGFGSIALFAHLAHADGVSTSTLVFLRFALGAAMLGAWIFINRIPLPRGRALAGYSLIGGGLYAAAAAAYFAALQHASSGLVSLLLYTNPICVAVISAIAGFDRLGRIEIGALLLAAVGLTLTLAGDHSGQPIGIALGLLGGVVYALYIVTGSRLPAQTSPLAGAFVVLASGALVHGSIAAVTGFDWPDTSRGWLAAIGIGIFGSAFAIGAFLAGLRQIGPTRASVLSTVEPLVTVTLGAVFLGERWQAQQLFGGLVILLAATLIATASGRRAPQEIA